MHRSRTWVFSVLDKRQGKRVDWPDHQFSLEHILDGLRRLVSSLANVFTLGALLEIMLLWIIAVRRSPAEDHPDTRSDYYYSICFWAKGRRFCIV